MGVIITPQSELGKELRKWEQTHTQYSIDENGESKPGNPYVYRPYPKMLYKANALANGKPSCMAPAPQVWDFTSMDQYERALLTAETFTKSCQKIVKDEAAYAIAKGQGWAESPKDALELYEQQQQAIAQAAAEAAHAVQRMSEKAKAEHAAAEKTTSAHVTDLVSVPKSKRGRKPKAKPMSGSTAIE